MKVILLWLIYFNHFDEKCWTFTFNDKLNCENLKINTFLFQFISKVFLKQMCTMYNYAMYTVHSIEFYQNILYCIIMPYVSIKLYKVQQNKNHFLIQYITFWNIRFK